MSTKIEAIETHYKGYRFRSRLEARWAVFFDHMEYNWEYEPEGFKLPNGEWYLPDFRISGEDMNGDFNIFWLEVKPSIGGMSDAEHRKVDGFQGVVYEALHNRSLYNYTERLFKGYGDFIILDGPPALKLYGGTWCEHWYMGNDYRNRPSFYENWDDAKEYLSGQGPRRKQNVGLDFYAGAVAAARSARFEHGETGT